MTEETETSFVFQDLNSYDSFYITREKMLINQYFDCVEVKREEKAIIVTFSEPFRVGSTCQFNGGVKDDLRVIFNHQSCEPSGHQAPLLKTASREPDVYHQIKCELLNLLPEQSASLGTAANMNNVAIAHEQFLDLEVVAIATGGVEGNAGRAGDPASYYESDGRFINVSGEDTPSHGTINTIILINQEVSPGATFRSVMMATEAKTALLQELGVYSRYSEQLATGTGTDQIAVASKLGTGKPLTTSGKHSKLGELIAKATHQAIKETLESQNQLTASSQCSILAQIGRFDIKELSLKKSVMEHLDEANATLLENNFITLERDPITVGAVSGLLHIYDQVKWGVIPLACLNELTTLYSAEIAAAVSGDYNSLSKYREMLIANSQITDSQMLLNQIIQALAIGYTDKWKQLITEKEHASSDPLKKEII